MIKSRDFFLALILLAMTIGPLTRGEIIWREDFENKDQVYGRWREEKLNRKTQKMVPAPGVLSLSRAKKKSGKQCARLDMDVLRKSGNKRNFGIVITTELPPNKGGVLTVWIYDYNESYAYYSGAQLNNGHPPNKRPQASLFVRPASSCFRFMGRAFKGSELTDVRRHTGWRKLQFVLGKEKTKGKIRAYVDGCFAGETKATYESFQNLSIGAVGNLLLRFWPLFFDDITLDDDPDAIEKDLFRGVDLFPSTDRTGNVFYEREELEVKTKVRNCGDKLRKLRISGILKDENGVKLEEFAAGALVEVPCGEERETLIKFPAPKRKGPLFATISAETDGRVLAKKEIGLGVIANPRKIIEDGSSIIGSHFPIGWMPPMRRFVNPGFVCHRQFNPTDNAGAWPAMEPKRGEIKWEDMDGMINDIRTKHMYPEIMYTLNSCPLWASSPERRDKAKARGCHPLHVMPADLADWRNYVEKMVARYKGQVRTWEIWNEPNARFQFDGSYQEYVQLLKTASEAIKKIDPEAKIVGPACSGLDLRYLEEIFKLGALKYLDVVCFHYYPKDIPEKDLLGRIQAVRRLMGEYGGGDKPIWDGEFGYYTMGLNEKNRPKTTAEVERDKAYGFVGYEKMISDCDVANRVARMFILKSANGVERTFYHFFAMVHGNGMATYFTYSLAAVVQELSGTEFVRRVNLGDEDLHAYLFKKGDAYFAALWSTEGPENIALHLDRAEYQLMDKWGNVETKKAPSKEIKLLLTESPVYLKGIGPDLAQAPKNLTIKYPLLVEKMVFPLKITLRNQSSNPLKGTITSLAPKNWKAEPPMREVEIPANSVIDVDFNLTVAPGTCKGVWPVRAEFLSADGKSKWLDKVKIKTMIPLACPLRQTTVKLDGDLSDWPVWGAAQTIKERSQVKIGLPPQDHMLYDKARDAGETFWEGADDASLAFQTAWDENFFYIAAKVRDDTVRNQHPKSPFFGDSLELFLDTRTSVERMANREQVKVFQFIFAPLLNENKSPGAWVFRNGLVNLNPLDAEVRAKKNLPLDLNKIAVASKISGNGYNLEIRIPFTLFAFQKPKAGEVFGLDLALDDQDQPDKKRESQSIWMGGKDNCGDPNLFGTVKLVEE